MFFGRNGAGADLLQRSLRASWLLLFALTALLLPSRPLDAVSLAAGQIVSAFNFFVLEKLVKLFTEAAVARSAAEASAMRARLLLLAGAKIALVYGGAFALTRWPSLRIGPLLLGLSLPLIALFLKSLMLAFASGPESFRPRARASRSPWIYALTAGASLLAAAPALAADPHAAAAESGGGGATHLPNWVTILYDFFPGSPLVAWLHANEYLVFAWLAALVFFGFTWFAMRRPTSVPGHLQNAVEWVVESMEEVCGGMLGKHLHRYFPFVMAIFFYILFMNLLGIIPGMKSSTSTLDVTLALALITFGYVQFSGIRNLGLLGYLDHLAGSPRDVVGFAMLPVMIPVHILGELVKPVSLSCRLFGNIFGEDTLIVVFVGVAAMCLKASLGLLALPPMMGITALFMMLQTLTSIVQALIFSLLTTVYLYMMLPHEAHAHGEGEHAH